MTLSIFKAGHLKPTPAASWQWHLDALHTRTHARTHKHTNTHTHTHTLKSTSTVASWTRVFMQMIMHTAANTPSFQCRKQRFSHPTGHYRCSPSCGTHNLLDFSMFNILHGKDCDYTCISVSVQGCMCMKARAAEWKRGRKIKKDRLWVRDKKTDHSLLPPPFTSKAEFQ